MHTKTLTELSLLLQKKQCSSKELTKYFLSRLKKWNPTLNAMITITEKTAMKEAEAADKKIAKHKTTPLTGLPIIHKDLLCTKGIRTTCASKMLDQFIAPYDATAVKKLKNAGMVLLGKCNMDEFAMGSSNENSYYGPVKNPWDFTRVPGGSSGGSSAIVAARLAPATTGTDTGGSIRQPAAFSGITGLKPTYGRVSRWGFAALSSNLDQAGPMTQTAEDAALLLEYMAGFDEKDSTSMNEPVPCYRRFLNRSIKGLRIGLPKEYFNPALDARIGDIIYKAIEKFESLGATMHEITLPHVTFALPVYYILGPVIASSNLARYDGVRFGYRCQNPKDTVDLFMRSRGEAFGDEVKRRIMIGTYLLSSAHYNTYYHKAQQIQRLIANDHQKAFKTVDVILSSTTPTVAFPLKEHMHNRVQMYASDLFTMSANLAGLPAISIPAGFHQHLPIGLQLVGNYLEEARLLNMAHQFQKITDYHQKIPRGFE